MLRLAKCSANLCTLSSQMKKLRQVNRCGSRSQLQIALVKALRIQFIERESRLQFARGLKWLMMDSGTSIERLHELISLKLT